MTATQEVMEQTQLRASQVGDTEPPLIIIVARTALLCYLLLGATTLLIKKQ